MYDMSWLKPGAEVVKYSLNRGMGSPDAVVTTIKRVNKVTFTVEGTDRRFSVNDGYSRGDGWNVGYRVVPTRSDEATRELNRVEQHKQRLRVKDRYERWIKKPSHAHRQALIDALNAITYDEG